jgi:hypothetical protein
MISRATLAATILASAFFAVPAHAEADDSQYVVKFEGTRTRAEVQAEAAVVPRTRSTEPAGSRIAPPLRSPATSEAVRAEAVRAVRLGLTTKGEL